ncbi:IucA/IucC family protein [Cohnella rhizosphaerae]|uniref:IucA/IucC family siderophore biosynthesis protein n=1 Tax=Cohnella rhizosphaerae TaxID=1457232 RepID=A0A9X4KXE0_9BACL|nr:IucA/IucC family protein [Cohnella rhizosphaerae]MDG0809782.1 hypothetical protein [Cohnella rhizosphaerae]
MPATEEQRRLEAEELANRQTCKILLNCYIRERCCEHPALFNAASGGRAFAVDFPASGVRLTGRLSMYAATGEHEYGHFDGREPTSAELAGWIVAELRREDASVTDEQAADFMDKVAGSCRNMALFAGRAKPARDFDYLSSEQSLLFGHPFHPFPKNMSGFTAADVSRFAPELGNGFPLCYMAVRGKLYREEWLSGRRTVEPQGSVVKRAREKLGDAADEYGLLPVHPWQYEHVLGIPAVEAAIARGDVVPLGGCGPMAYPTSSVRTVYVPDMRCNIKLPLDIQITNLRRNNTREQMRRTMDAAAYVRDSGCFGREPHTRIASEEGVCGCAFGDESLEALLTVAYRPVLFDTKTTYVLSSLAEAPAGEGPSRLSQVMDRRRAEPWFRRYLDISLLPLVRAAEEKGIHFEAHLQNALLTVRDGMPETFIVRDLEGVSVDRDLAARGANPTGPLFYDKAQARARTDYYLIVNHLGSFIHAIARETGLEEMGLWSVVRESLAREYARTGNAYARHLLTADVLYAKKNMASCLAAHGESPSYVPLKNLLKSKGSECHERD